MTQHVHVTEAEPVDPNQLVQTAEADLIGAPRGTDPPASNDGRPRVRWPQWWPNRLRLRTLTARLVAGVVALVILVSLATGVGTYYFLHGFLFSRLDQQVQGQAAQIVNSVFHGDCDPAVTVCSYTDQGRFGGPPSSDRNQYFVVLSSSGAVRSQVEPGSVIAALNLGRADRMALAGAPSKPRTVSTTDGHRVRVQVISHSGLSVVSGISTEEVDGTLHQLILREIAVGGAGVFLAFVLSLVGLTVGLGPLKRVTRTAQEVTAELSPQGAGLDRRVPETDSSTEVGQLATSFNTMLDTVQTEFTARRESEERMRQFLADASHELRTPLTSIRGYAELARMQKARSNASGVVGVDDGADDTIGRIETEGTRMSRLVEDLLILARGDDPNDNSAERDVVDVDEVVEDAITDLRLSYPERTVTADVQPGLRVIGDRDQLLRLVRNLTGNAAVHTDADGPIRVTAQREADNIVVQVIDTGPGLAPEEAAHVFERFWRADRARTRVRGGSGLGMAIVAQIVSAHGGRAFFDSSVPGGSTVTVVLPAIA